RQDQPEPAEDHRRADRTMGNQGLGGRDQGRRAAQHDAARDGQAGGGGAREAREDHQRRRRVSGLADPGERGAGDLVPAGRAPAPVPPDDGGDRLREEHDDHPPAAHRAHPPADRHGETRRWLAGAAAARQRHQDRLIAHLPLDAGTALVELLPLPLIILANAAVGKTWAAVATPALAALPAVMTGLVGVLDLLGAPTGATGLSRQATFAVDAGTIVTAVAAGGFAFRPIRQDLAALLPIDPNSPVHALALVLATIFFGTQVTFIAFTDVLAANNAQPALTLVDLFLNEVPFLILALAGVGVGLAYFKRRTVPEAMTRLGLVRPAWWHLALALIRKYTNTTTSCICHVSYNLLVGIGLTGFLLSGAFVIEMALVAITGYAIWANRRRAAMAGGSP